MIVDILGRYWDKVDRKGPDDCWLWFGARTTGGYGQLSNGTVKRNRARRSLATHIALAIDGQARPSPEHVAMHRCDNPRCVNPRHLQWGTQQENMIDRSYKEAVRKQIIAEQDMDEAAGRLNGSKRAKLSEEDVRRIRTSKKTTIALAEEMGVTNQAISNVRTGRTWSSIV